MDYVNAAIASLELSDEKTYLSVREEMAARFRDAYEMAPWRSLEVGLLRPIDDRAAATFQHFADGLAHWSRKETNDYWGLMLLSLYSYRLGDYDSAIGLARQSLDRHRDGTRLPNAELSIIFGPFSGQTGKPFSGFVGVGPGGERDSDRSGCRIRRLALAALDSRSSPA